MKGVNRGGLAIGGVPPLGWPWARGAHKAATPIRNAKAVDLNMVSKRGFQRQFPIDRDTEALDIQTKTKRKSAEYKGNPASTHSMYNRSFGITPVKPYKLHLFGRRMPLPLRP